ncbi:MAG TPA: hypothetical protein VM925_00080 [Labilithrix sp.]|nr:hypothetical protein [Labilithrix sp.]
MDSPYREPKPLAALIPPDRRRRNAAALVLTSMLAGAALWELAHRALAERESNAAPPPQPPTVVPVVPAPAETLSPAPALPSEPSSSSQVAIERVVAAHRGRLKQRCWDSTKAGPRVGRWSADVTLDLVVGANGNVVSSSASGTDALITSCVEREVRTWTFPAHDERRTIRIPIRFLRQ